MSKPQTLDSWLEPAGIDIRDEGGEEEPLDGGGVLPARGPWPEGAYITIIHQVPPKTVRDMEKLYARVLKSWGMSQQDSLAWTARLAAYAAKSVVGFKGKTFTIGGQAPELPEDDVERANWFDENMPTPVLAFLSREVNKLTTDPSPALSEKSSGNVSGPSSIPALPTTADSAPTNGTAAPQNELVSAEV